MKSLIKKLIALFRKRRKMPENDERIISNKVLNMWKNKI